MTDGETRMKRAEIGLPGVAALVLAVAGCVVPVATAQDAPGKSTVSPYDRLPTDRLIRQLSFLGMVELLDEMEKEIPATDTSPEAKALRGRVRIGQALAMAEPEDRNARLDEAIPLLKEAVQAAEKRQKAAPKDTLEKFRWMLDLAVAMGRYRVENPHVLRLRFLQGGPEDIQVILKFTKGAVDLLDPLKDEVSDTLTRWRPDMDIMIIWVPPLEDLEDQLKYNAGWIRMHRAIALEKGAERDQLCRDIVAEMKKFTTDPESGVMYWALYVTGIAQRLLGEHDQAEATLLKAAGEAAEDGDLRQRALVEWARSLIERGDAAKGLAACDDFRKRSLEVWGEGHEVRVDLLVVFLKNFLYERAAAAAEAAAGAEKDAAKAKALRDAVPGYHAKAEEVLLSFLEKYADRQEIVKEYLRMIGTKFADVADPRQAGAIVMLARAYAKVDSDKPQDMAETEKLLRGVLVHKDMKSPKVAAAIQPGVLWELAFLMNKTKRNADAATYFLLLSKLYPKHRLASEAATFAVRSLYGVLEERRAKRQPVTGGFRQEYIRVIDNLLAGWAGNEGSAKWNYDLANQCMALGTAAEEAPVKLYWQTRAIAAYEKVPAELVEYMESQHSALDLRSRIVLERDDLAKQLAPGNEKAGESLRRLAAQLATDETVSLRSLPPAGGVPPTTAPAGEAVAATQPTTAPTSEPATQASSAGAEAFRKRLEEQLKVYSDAAALTQRLQKYAVDAGAAAR